MPETNINVLVLGQTGSGKSTLINYLYGSEVVKTGMGRPVTGKGDFSSIQIHSPLKQDIVITILDSWGLESNRAEEWKKLIKEKLSATLNYKEMIYGVIYCLSYSQDRIQDFEIEMLKELLGRGYKTIIAFTNADNGGYDSKKNIFRDKLKNDLPDAVELYDTVDICAASLTKLGQKEAVLTFGKEELFKQIEKDMLINFSKVFLENLKEWRTESLKNIDLFYRKKTAEIDHFYKPKIFVSVEKQAREAEERIRTETENMANEIIDKVKTAIEQAFNLHSKMTGSFDKEFKFMDWDILLVLIPHFGWLFNFFSRKGRAKKILIENFNKAIEALKADIEKIYTQAVAFGNKMK